MDEQDRDKYDDEIITVMGVTAPRRRFLKAIQRQLDRLDKERELKEKEKEVDN